MTKIPLRILFIIIFFSWLYSLGQERGNNLQSITDSLITELEHAGEDTGKVNILLGLSNRFSSNKPERSLKYANYAYNLSKKLKYLKGISLSYNYIFNYHKNKGNYDKALDYALKSLKICKETGDNMEIARDYNNLGMLYLTMDDPDTANHYLSKSIDIYKKMLRKKPDDLTVKSSMASSYLNLGNTFITKGDYEKSLEYYYRSLKIYEKTRNNTGLRTCYHNIGAINFKLKKYDLALEYMLKSLEINKKIGDKRFTGTLVSNIGVIYENMSLSETDSNTVCDMLKKALDYHYQSLKNKKELEDKKGIVISYYNIGSIYESMGNNASDPDTAGFYYGKAMDYYNKTLLLSEENNFPLFISYSCQGIGTVNYSKGKYTNALEYMLRSYKIAEELDDRERILSSAEKLSKIYSALNRYRESLYYYQIFSDNKDSIFNIESNEKIAELNEKYEDEIREKKIQVLEAEKEIKSSELKTKNNLLYIFIAGFIMILLFFIIIIYLYLQKIRSNKQLAIKNLEIVESEKKLQGTHPATEEKYDPEMIPENDMPMNNNKYKDSSLTDEQKQYIKERIIYAIEQKKLYLDKDITIDKLSSYLKTSRSYVSRVINEEFKQNFISLINEYRIKEARRLLSDKENIKYTIESVSKQVGFNSITTFIRAFKKYTGITPSFFAKSSHNKRNI